MNGSAGAGGDPRSAALPTFPVRGSTRTAQRPWWKRTTRPGPEMGVGYRVYLKKSPKTQKWFIAGANMTRIS